MSIALIREHYDYHRWANRRLFDLAVGPGRRRSGRDMGTHWSFPTLKGDVRPHLRRPTTSGSPAGRDRRPSRLLGDADFASMTDLRATLGRARGGAAGLRGRARARPISRGPIEYRNTEGKEFQVALGALLQHVVNHATHHRSEAATMITLISGSPPDTGINTYRVSRREGLSAGGDEGAGGRASGATGAGARAWAARGDRQAARGGEADRPRAPGPALRRGLVPRDRACSPPTPTSRPSMTGRETPADGVVTGFGRIERAPAALDRLRLHGHGRLDGAHRRRSSATAPGRSRSPSACR